MTSHQTSLRESSPQHGGARGRGTNESSNVSLLASCAGTSPESDASSNSSSNDVMVTIRHYVQQVLLLMQTMLTVIESTSQQNQTGAAVPMDETPAEANSDHQNQVNFLKTKLKELVGMNVGWQTAHSLQEQRIAELEEMNRQLTLQLQNLSVAGAAGQLTEQQQTDIDRVLLEQRHKYEALEENCRQLEIQLSQCKDHIQVMEMQANVYKEDFETERKDRERAQSRVCELEVELEQCKNSQVIPGSMLPVFGDPTSQFCASATNSSRSHWQQQQKQLPQRPRIAAGYGCRYQTDVHDGDVQVDGVDRYDGFVNVDFVPRGGVDDSKPGRGKDVTDSAVEVVPRPKFVERAELKCPKCHKEFTEDDHVAFMDHLDTCVDTM